MGFSRQLSSTALIDLCRTLRHSLAAGLPLVDVFRRHAERRGAAAEVAGRVAARLQKGDSLRDALERERDAFPPLFRATADAGEQSGNLPEVFAQLERYYQLQQKLARQFRGRLFFQLAQLGFAFLIIAAVIWIVGTTAGDRAPAILGFRGAAGAAVFLALSFGTIVLLFVAYKSLARLRGRAGLSRLWLRLPLVGPCAEALALGRFALGLRLTLDSSLPVAKALRLSLAATGNAAFEARADAVVAELKAGRDLTSALAQVEILPARFLEMVAVGEEGGRLPEVMEHQFNYYQEEAERRLAALARVGTALVWLVYAGFMVVAIFRLYGVYLAGFGG